MTSTQEPLSPLLRVANKMVNTGKQKTGSNQKGPATTSNTNAGKQDTNSALASNQKGPATTSNTNADKQQETNSALASNQKGAAKESNTNDSYFDTSGEGYEPDAAQTDDDDKNLKHHDDDALDEALAKALQEIGTWTDQKVPDAVLKLYQPGFEVIKANWGKTRNPNKEDKIKLLKVKSDIQLYILENEIEDPQMRQVDWDLRWEELLILGDEAGKVVRGYEKIKADPKKASSHQHTLKIFGADLDKRMENKGIKLEDFVPQEDLDAINNIVNGGNAKMGGTGEISPSGNEENRPRAGRRRTETSSDIDDPYPGQETAVPSINENKLGKRVHIRKSGRGGYRVIVNRGTIDMPLYQIRPGSDWGTADEFTEAANPRLDKEGLESIRKGLQSQTAFISACIQVHRDVDLYDARRKALDKDDMKKGADVKIRGTVAPPTYIMIKGKDGSSHWLTKSEFITLKGQRVANSTVRRKLNEQADILAWWKNKLENTRHPTEKRKITDDDIQGRENEQLSWLVDGEDLPNLDGSLLRS